MVRSFRNAMISRSRKCPFFANSFFKKVQWAKQRHYGTFKDGFLAEHKFKGVILHITPSASLIRRGGGKPVAPNRKDSCPRKCGNFWEITTFLPCGACSRSYSRQFFESDIQPAAVKKIIEITNFAHISRLETLIFSVAGEEVFIRKTSSPSVW